jgi:REP element-mobilizing transposase RayT
MPDEREGIVFRRNRLPQWRLDGGRYFVTWRLEGKDDCLSPAERSIVLEEILRWKDERYLLSIAVVMDDHVHLVLQTMPGHDLSDVLQQWKGASAFGINRLRGCKGKRWQKASYTELLSNDAAVESRRIYVYENPRRRWGTEPHLYKWLIHFI